MNKIIFLVFIVFLQSCGLPYCNKTQFDKEDLLWVNTYKLNDKLIFYCEEFSSTDTIIVSDFYYANPKNRNTFDLEGCNWEEGSNEFHANSFYKLHFLTRKENDLMDSRFGIDKIFQDKPVHIICSLLGNYSNEILQSDSLSDYIIKDRKYDDCLILKNNDFCKGKDQKIYPIKQYVWSKSKGLILYEIEGEGIYILERVITQ